MRQARNTCAHEVALFVFGQLSYPLYILHYPFIRLFSHFARAHDLHGLQFSLLIIAEMLSAIGFSFGVMKLFDEPVRAWLTRQWRSWRSTLTRTLNAVEFSIINIPRQTPGPQGRRAR